MNKKVVKCLRIYEEGILPYHTPFRGKSTSHFLPVFSLHCCESMLYYEHYRIIQKGMRYMNENKKKGISLLHKSKKGIISMVFSRMGLIVLLLLFQIVIFTYLIQRFESYVPEIYSITAILSGIMALYLLNSHIDASAKLTWLVVIVVLPAFGALFYLYTQMDIGHRALKERVHRLSIRTRDLIPQSDATMQNLKKQAPGVAALAQYITRNGCYPVFENTQVTYFPSGEAKFEEMLIQLEKAQNFIYLEYFIVNEGTMWGLVLEILVRKAAEGVDVRMLYDGTCEFSTLPHNYPQLLQQLGIKCKMFAPITPFISTHYNYRDHRKILVVDGRVSFTGGINLADEYINEIDRFGHWKDTAVMLEGDATRSFTLMFLQMWYLDEKNPEFTQIVSMPSYKCEHADGFVIPYGDCPLDHDKVGEQVYMDILNRAQHYVHIMTPYLILDGEMENALIYAAERGVDVRLILPGIPDKKIPYALALTHYASLLDAGVKIYEYTPGFVHAKVFVCDNREAVVGTINLDYRSLYHHFECAAYMYGVKCIPDIESDFQQTQNKCRTITQKSIHNESAKRKFVGFVMKAVAPLL